MKKIIIFLVIILVGAWALQNYTSFKAFDLAEKYYQQIDLGRAKAWVEDLNLQSLFGGAKKIPDAEKRLNIFIRENGFLPNKNVVKAGAKVTWYNEDSRPHAVSGDGWGSAEIAPGKAWSKTFDLAGTYAYSCSLHPSEKGELIVGQ